MCWKLGTIFATSPEILPKINTPIRFFTKLQVMQSEEAVEVWWMSHQRIWLPFRSTTDHLQRIGLPTVVLCIRVRHHWHCTYDQPRWMLEPVTAPGSLDYWLNDRTAQGGSRLTSKLPLEIDTIGKLYENSFRLYAFQFVTIDTCQILKWVSYR